MFVSSLTPAEFNSLDLNKLKKMILQINTTVAKVTGGKEYDIICLQLECISIHLQKNNNKRK